MTMAANSSRAFAVWWKDFDRWNVDYFHSARWNWPAYVLKRLADFTTVEARPIATSDAQEQGIPIISKINFGGELFLRGSDDYENYKGRLFLVSPDRLIFSKINAKRGCIYFSSANQKPFAVSSEYPILKLDTEKALGDYLSLAMRVGPAREALLGSASGMAKARTNLEDFRNIVIPLPSLTEQEAIVARWRKAQDEITAARGRVDMHASEIQVRFLANLGFKPQTLQQQPRVFAVLWKDLFALSARATFLSVTKGSLNRGKYPVVLGSDCLSEVRHGCSASPSPKPTGLEVLKISAVTRGAFNPMEKKFALDSDRVRVDFALKKGDVLLCRTNGTLAYVGMSALVSEDMPNLIFPDKVIRVRVRENILPEYLWQVLQSYPVRAQIEAAARTAVGNFAIGTEDIWNLQIPLPPLAVQQEIMERVARSRTEIAREREATGSLSISINAEIEARILGTQSLKDT